MKEKRGRPFAEPELGRPLTNSARASRCRRRQGADASRYRERLAMPIPMQIEHSIEEVLAQAQDATIAAIFLHAFAREVERRQIELCGREIVADAYDAHAMRLRGAFDDPPA